LTEANIFQAFVKQIYKIYNNKMGISIFEACLDLVDDAENTVGLLQCVADLMETAQVTAGKDINSQVSLKSR